MSIYEQLGKDMPKLFALGCMGQSGVNGIEQFQLQTNKL